MSGIAESRRTDFLPLIVLVVVVAVDLAVRQGPLTTLTVIAPLLAGNVCSERLTAAYGALALATAALLGLRGGAYADNLWIAQVVRLCGIALGTAISVWAAHRRLDREKRLATMTRIAEVAQRIVLPPVPERVGDLELAAHYESAAANAAVGGDFYAAMETPWGTRLLIGDVRGKGLLAVRTAADVLGAFRERAGDPEKLGELMECLEVAARRTLGEEDFVTALLVQIEPHGVVSVTSAGHHSPLIVTPDLAVEQPPLEYRPPLGLGGTATVHQFTLSPAQRLLMYTDGLIEARRPGDGQFFPEGRVLSALSHGSLNDAVDHLREELLRWVGGRLRDDVALVVAQRTD